MSVPEPRRVGLALKRIFDVIVALALTIVLAPLAGIVALVIWAGMGRPVLFKQPRPGRNGEVFELVKFRTMRPVGEMGEGGTSHDRITPVGRFLRRYGLDEMPELINVLKGEMSIVGPRPLLVSYLAKYTPEEARRHEMRPGVTGLAQVSGRQGLLYSRKLELDVWYVDNWSWWLDLKILVRTVGAVFGSSGRPVEDYREVDDRGLMSGEPPGRS